MLFGLTILFMEPLQSEFLKVDQIKTIKKGFKQSRIGGINIINSNGNIDVEGWDLDSVDIVVNMKIAADNESELETLFQQLMPVIEKNGENIRITTQRKTIKKTIFFGIFQESIYYSYDLFIHVPTGLAIRAENRYGNTRILNTESLIKAENYNGAMHIVRSLETEIHNKYGDTEVRDVKGALTLDNYDGKVNVSDAQGETRLNNRYGDIEASDINGPLYVKNYDGNVRLVSILKGAEVYLKYSDLSITSATGDMRIENYSGDNTLEGITGNITLDNKYGSVTVNKVDGSLQISNYNDDIRVENVNGNLKIDCKYGSIYASRISQEVVADNYSGEIRLTKIGGSITANNRYGDIRIVEAPPLIRSLVYNGDIYADKIGGGTASIHLESSYGDVKLAFEAPVSAAGNFEVQYGKVTLHGGMDWKLMKSNDKTFATGTAGAGAGELVCKIYSGDLEISMFNPQ